MNTPEIQTLADAYTARYDEASAHIDVILERAVSEYTEDTRGAVKVGTLRALLQVFAARHTEVLESLQRAAE